MRQILFTIPGIGFRVYAFSLFMAMGSMGGVLISAWRARRENINPEIVFELAVWLLSGGFIGARVLYLIQYPETIPSFLDLFKVWQGGIVFYGCIIGGLIGTLIYYRRSRFPFLPMADVVATALALGVMLGRVGCWLNGCCYGAICHSVWGETFPSGSMVWVNQVELGLLSPLAPRSLPVVPTQLLLAGEGAVLLAFLTWFYPRRTRDGQVMAILMMGYSLARFLTESLRADDDYLILGMTLSQVISLGLFAGGVVLWFHLKRHPRPLYAEVHKPQVIAASGPHRPVLAASGKSLG